MSGRTKFVAGVVLGTVLSFPSWAAADIPLNTSGRAAVVKALARELNANYIEPAVAKRVAGAIAKKDAAGGYAAAASAQAFSAALAKDLRAFSGDLHFGARVDEGGGEHDEAVRGGSCIEKIDHLPGNVGYIELRDFAGPRELAGPAYTAALAMVAGTDALILDLRRNGGGRAANVSYLLSHFFRLADRRHLNDIYDRPSDTTRAFWTEATPGKPYDKPVYVLTANRTFSAGEECAYDFQTQKRATLVGETTGGGANPVGWFRVGQGILVAIPTGRSINPVTRTSRERVGVKPDVAVPATQALQVAHVAILRKLAASGQDDDARAKLRRVLAMVEKGEVEKPVYTLRGEPDVQRARR